MIAKNFCKNCKCMVKRGLFRTPYCNCVATADFNLVTGKIKMRKCVDVRREQLSDTCPEFMY